MEPEDERRLVNAQLREAYHALAPEAADKLGIDESDDDARAVLIDLCIRMFNAGVRAGGAQAAAQLIEQGHDVKINVDAFLADLGGPLPGA
jgi:hypothetical protein